MVLTDHRIDLEYLVLSSISIVEYENAKRLPQTKLLKFPTRITLIIVMDHSRSIVICPHYSCRTNSIALKLYRIVFIQTFSSCYCDLIVNNI